MLELALKIMSEEDVANAYELAKLIDMSDAQSIIGFGGETFSKISVCYQMVAVYGFSQDIVAEMRTVLKSLIMLAVACQVRLGETDKRHPSYYLLNSRYESIKIAILRMNTYLALNS